MARICPKTIKLRKASTVDITHYPDRVTLLSNSKTANLTAINCNTEDIVDLKFLACKENKSVAPNDCDYHHSPEAQKSVCEVTDGFAHIYITNNVNNPMIKHYLILFVEGTKIGRKDDLINILNKTVNWLNICAEKPHFYIFFYGPPTITNELSNIRSYVNKTLKKTLGNYNQYEDICQTSNVVKDSTFFTISRKNSLYFVIG